MMPELSPSGDKSKSNNNSNSNNTCHISPFNKLLLVCNISFLLLTNFRLLLSSSCTSATIDDNVVTSSFSTSSSSSSSSLFDEAAQHLFEIATSSTTNTLSSVSERKEFPTDVNEWKAMKLTTAGGLSDNDRIALGKIYGTANSIFEYGLGESTSIAAYVGVPRYSGVDSDPHYVSQARTLAPDYFRFYFADIGPTQDWGHPTNKKLRKNKFNYQVSSLLSEKNKPFDVYMIDGRYRLPCVLISLLHAASSGMSSSSSPSSALLTTSSSSSSSVSSTTTHSAGPIMLLHDCLVQNSTKTAKGYKSRSHYKLLNSILDQIDATTDTLCVYQRKPTTTDQMIYDMWMQYQDNIN